MLYKKHLSYGIKGFSTLNCKTITVELAIGATTEIYFSVVGMTVVCEKRFVCVHEIKIGHIKLKLWFSFYVILLEFSKYIK